ncbi:MAG: hypothetical protein Q8R81_11405 [Novosphingobium sp.]|uniref:hypothetical protein n=1 Tax=Novosphingobium sp. TaxID=1874826 RepID=UPI002736745E|nr:hypothetical protein [Novosphingobium sp.]MDP3550989.1 hypothetical protein [Novosphingobium sp.]
MSSERHTTAAWVLAISVIGFAALVFNGVSEARKNPDPGSANSVTVSSDPLPVEDPNAESIPLDKQEGPNAPDDTAPAE